MKRILLKKVSMSRISNPRAIMFYVNDHRSEAEDNTYRSQAEIKHGQVNNQKDIS